MSRSRKSTSNKLFTSIISSMGYYSAQCFTRLDEVRKSFTPKVKKRRLKRAKTTTTTAAATNISSSENDDKIPFVLNLNDDSFGDISNNLNALNRSQDVACSDYEPGGDD
ncbi:unnamed protein product [Didymodactylos carnosus]|uniref:Uncharacterized protein n=1 Tax=Didymodactylos carnosus TaxID=1234261 RepID=A0A813NUC0_9BILA|nr:unnamed protein product [Didymodactylos carnosus]CAF1367605.1 unnamed protein product [Didymodactylos carnosus]CAF3523835.1 unnamed protein product [Didymodactylos carnosus]CAF4176959.1 unnamed protein product [Didymodactylos carnosus]